MLYPAAKTKPNPDADKLGPVANSKPPCPRTPTKLEKLGKNIPFSIPPTKATHSTSPTIGPPESAKRVSHCHPY